MSECEYCKQVFNNKYTLGQHQKTAKYCLSLQGVINTSFICNHCNKNLSTNDKLNAHYQSCKELRKKIQDDIQHTHLTHIKKLEAEIIELKQVEKENIKKIIEEKDILYQKDIKEKNEYIAKLEARLDKFDQVITNMQPRSQPSPKEDTNSNNIPIPLHEQMSSIIIEEIDDEDENEYSNITLNNVVITSRPIDHYVNATQLCQAGGKKFSEWYRLDTTKELIKELSTDAGILTSALVEIKRGGNNKTEQESWIHPDLSIQLAQWIQPKFALQVSKWIRTLFSQGTLEIDVGILREKERNLRLKDQRIKQLENVCLSKQRRVEYPERNVIYLITTDDHLKRRTYIIGKAKNLTSRLSTYNKTCDHTVVYYCECKNEDDMSTAETMVLSKLRDYRETANHDRFILPVDKEVAFFIKTIEDCIHFLE